MTLYPDAIKRHTGPPFVRPAFTNDPTRYESGFYWENIEQDRFYFETELEAREDFETECGLRR